ncbi:TonB-dependent receptor domain-containing protein [Vibrio sp. LaRot3]|uniref:TonB-dependent receptor domain-containing protein n=1 Tax=Vibrio sp. LaRot3 TaxID=2998829 RepID=UPI0022CDF9D9|nr:TonB-dependent receptor [Vibrio sp. LaRot3]MDA0150273.1 TonB-dependent receptor [Vibrio sp. LaRot3]
MNKSILAVAVVSLLPYASFTQAQQSSADETVVVTANRFEQTLDSVIQPVEVVTKEEIDALQAKSLLEVLNRLPGIQITSNGGYGQSQSVFVRGTNSDHVLLLVDGVRTGSATLGSANISAMPLAGVQRIEYLRGPRAVAYGSDALGGVINVITDTNAEEVVLSLSAGSDAYAQGSLAIAHQLTEKLHSSITLNQSKTDGFSVQNGTGNEDDDGYDAKNVTAALTYKLNEQVQLGVQGFYHDGEVEYDAADAKKDETVYNVVAHINYQSAKWQSKLALSQNQDYNYNYAYDSEYQTDRTGVAWTNHYHVNNVISLGGGFDWYRDDVSESSEAFENPARDNFAIYTTGFATVGAFDFELALRHDDNEHYGNETTWQFATVWNLNDQYRLKVNSGTAFKAPTFNDLNETPNLLPEESIQYELAFEADYDLVDWRLAVYQNDIDNLIAWAPVDNAGTWKPSNVDSVEIFGAELVALFDTGPIQHELILEYLDAEDKSTGKQLDRRAKDSYKWNISYQENGWRGELSTLYQGDRTDGSDELDAYVLVDLAISYEVIDNLTLRARVANLFDEEYVLVDGYNTQERSYFGTVEYRF